MNPLSKPLFTFDTGSPAQDPSRKGATKRYLVNRLNYLNFQGQSVLVVLRHLHHENSVLLRATPLPCLGERLECRWKRLPNLGQLLATHRLDCLLVPDGAGFLLVHPEVIDTGEEGLSVVLPESCQTFTARQTQRQHACRIEAHCTQNGATFSGTLVDFTAISLHLEGEADPPGTLSWINASAPVHLCLYAGRRLVFSGECAIIRHGGKPGERSLVLRPLKANISRFAPKPHRNQRQRLVPSPTMVAVHPLSLKTVTLKLVDLSGSGFSVLESEGNSVLLPGMIIPQLKICFGVGLSISCQAQVLYRDPQESEKTLTCGVAILDMELKEQEKLLSVLHQAADPSAYLSNEVDLELLWEFFFDTGFIYPEKYLLLEGRKEEVKQTYHKLYGAHPAIARHFVYQEKGVLLGHMAILRWYWDAWMIHHHAARKNLSLRAGLSVLDQISQYLNELHNLPSAHLSFIFCYFRPDNKLPNRVFGGLARYLDDQQRCSLDRFAYAQYRREGVRHPALPEPWELTLGRPKDLSELEHFYSSVSGGLLLEAFDLLPDVTSGDELAREYRRSGFRKEKRIFALRRGGRTALVAVADYSDAGLNLSDLTNCVTLFVLDDSIPVEVVEIVLARLSARYRGHEMPVLTYPESFAQKKPLPHQKSYLLWILDLEYGEEYLTFFEGLGKGLRKKRDVMQ